jgi:2,4-dienoyl-CoA reductase-like NADH-dependent reductase (Old Yellow Enzyme family)
MDSDFLVDGLAANLFQPAVLGPLAVRNRFAMAPMTRCQCPQGVPGPDVAQYYRRRAEGGVALIISEGTSVDHPGASNDANIPRFHGEDALAGWGDVVDEVHACGARMVPQLWHVGLVRKRKVETLSQGTQSIPEVSPSGVLNLTESIGEPMDTDDIDAVIRSFGDAAARAYRLGFDGIELQGAHGYLLDQFLWAVTNRRRDAFGGDITRRSRFAAEIVRECRLRTAPDFPIIFRFSQWKQQDYTARLATTAHELEQVLAPIVDAGADIFHCSQRRFWQAEFEGSERSLAGWTKVLTGKPVIVVGSVGLDRDMASAGFAVGATASTTGLGQLPHMLQQAEFDMVAIGRALIANPDWCALARTGRLDAAVPYSSTLLQELR